MERSSGQRHHVNFPARMHRVMPESKWIREHPTLIPRIAEEQHVALHSLISAVPVADYHMVRRVARDYTPSDDPMQAIDNLIKSYDTATRHPRARIIEKEVGKIIIAAYEMQRPFIREGLYEIQR